MDKLIVLLFLLIFLGVAFLVIKGYGGSFPSLNRLDIKPGKGNGQSPQNGPLNPHWNSSFDKEYQKEDPSKRGTSYACDTMLIFTRKTGKKKEEYSFDWRGKSITIGRDTSCTIVLPGAAVPRKMMKISRGIMVSKGNHCLGYMVEMLSDTEGIVSYTEKNKVRYLYKGSKKDALNVVETTEFMLPENWKMKIVIVQNSTGRREAAVSESREKNRSVMEDDFDFFFPDEEEEVQVKEPSESPSAAEGSGHTPRGTGSISPDDPLVDEDDL